MVSLFYYACFIKYVIGCLDKTARLHSNVSTQIYGDATLGVGQSAEKGN